jgi:hypothetical protein
MKKTHFIRISICTLFVIGCLGAEQGATVRAPESIVKELSQKLEKLGSFQAEYQAIAPDKSADITLLYNKQQEYCLLMMTNIVMITEKGTNPTHDAYIIIWDFSKANDHGGTFKTLQIADGDEKNIEISLRDMTERLDNPIGLFLFMFKHGGSEMTTDGKKIDIQAELGTEIFLGLGKERIKLGISSMYDSFAVSWLDLASATNATKILELTNAIQFSYAENHVVVVDKKTGLLLDDSWPDPSRPGPRQIVLKRQAKLQTDAPYSSFVPSFVGIKAEKLSADALRNQLTIATLTDIGRKLSAIDNIDENLRLHSGAIVMAVRKAVRQKMRDEVTKWLDDQKVATTKEKTLMPLYKQYMERDPEAATGVSFHDFLDIMIAALEKNPRLIVSSSCHEHTEIIQALCKDTLAQLPEDAQKPLKKLYDVAMPALVDGMMVEYYAVLFEKIKKMDEKQDAAGN